MPQKFTTKSLASHSSHSIDMTSRSLYTPLNESRSEIRLLEIAQGGDNNNVTVECKLTVLSLKDNPKFTALSYCWGDAKVTENILLDGRITPVTTNLAAALKHVKNHWRTVFADKDPTEFRLWADAVCVNQADLKERSSQVRLMRAVFSNAELVIAWLGHGSNNIDAAFETFKIIAKEDIQQHDEMRFEWLRNYPSWGQYPEGHRERWMVLSEFGKIPYWRRVWIFQELVLGQRIFMAHGTSLMDFGDMWRAASWLIRLRQAVSSGHEEVLKFFDPDTFLALNQIGGWFELIRVSIWKGRLQTNKLLPESDMALLFGHTTDLQATDPRDHVYGILGILEIDIAPDYESSFSSVCHNYAEAFIKATGTLQFLEYAGIGTFKRDSTMTLPSWTPNFSQRAQMFGVPQRSGLANATMGFSNSRSDRGLFDQFTSQPRKEGSTLHAVAYLIAEVDTVYDQFPESAWDDGCFFEFVRDIVRDRITGDIWQDNRIVHPLGQIFRALVSNSVDQTKEVIIKQALAFFIRLVKTPDANATGSGQISERTLISERKRQLKFPEGKGFARGFLRAIPVGEDSNWVDYVDKTIQDQSHKLHIAPVMMGFWGSQVLYRFTTFNRGYLGLAPRYSHPGGIIAIVKGCNVPLILREVEGHYIVVGPCFVHGLMHGESVKQIVLTNGQSIKEIKIR